MSASATPSGMLVYRAPSAAAVQFERVDRAGRLIEKIGPVDSFANFDVAPDGRVAITRREPFINGMAKALSLIEEHGLQNIRLHHGDAAELLAWLPNDSLARVDLIYPDPWPKRRHWKRRFVQDASVTAIARVLRKGGEFRFATDIPDYGAWTLLRLLRSPEFVWTAEQADDWRRPWPGFTSTRYEAKAKREGRTPCYLIFRRV